MFYLYQFEHSLALERATTADEAINVISWTVEKYGSDVVGKDAPTFCFVICDTASAYLMNVIGKLWACEKLEESRSISSGISISTKIDKSSSDLKNNLQSVGLWDGSVRLNIC